MRRLIITLSVLTAACGHGAQIEADAAPPEAAQDEEAAVAIFRTVAPSVVLVVSRIPPFEARGPEQLGAGSGFIWDDEGRIVTNNHLVQTPEALVRLSNGDEAQARVIGRAPQYDIAVLQLESPPAAQPLTIGDSSGLVVGQSVFAIGNPFGLDQTLTSGIVSALGRYLTTPEGRTISGVIQTDAAINPGNSGGPLLDSSGRVIGVTTAIFSPSGAYAGVGFAVPIDTVSRIVPALIRTGRAPTPGIGILVADEVIVARLGVEGVLVWRAVPGGPAATAGLRGTDPQTGVLGDVIVAANGREVERLPDLIEELERIGIGEEITLTIRRNGAARDVVVPIEDVGDA